VQQPRDLEPELEPALGQTFLATAGCGLASTYVNSLLVQPTPNEMRSSLSCRLLTTPIELINIQQLKKQQQ
jgi:hypothetical protein